jgi:hypothetical protein
LIINEIAAAGLLLGCVGCCCRAENAPVASVAEVVIAAAGSEAPIALR